MQEKVRQLDAQQTTSFDTEYIDKGMFEVLTKQLNMLYPTQQPFHLLDVGGGNGMYADKILNHYPNAQVTLIEPEASLIAKNRPNPNKHLVCHLFQDAALESSFDIIQFNWVLHHFVTDTYQSTKQVQQEALHCAYRHLTPGGLIVMFENFYEGLLVNNLPSSLIYRSTSSKLLAPLTQRLGANTAGVGVCFHSRTTWHDMIIEAGFKTVLHVPFYAFGNLSSLKTKTLHLRKQNVGLLIGKK
ncbi:TPA: class I SAM-dependent methyltransferase [Vibrio harveyi]|uniref:class I SAM-dependent methyltransferase n=1 Tax=Vibrio harveyi TaxID=669 RepID=UPI00069F53EE|nr:class I SAM-dependent methyltransferase [Vibrio harveyi]KNY45169.1 methyltransferase [Vibrio harveyi]HDM8169040.1 class I SAM-dependent methyltransferase [Vibrio harveyi]